MHLALFAHRHLLLYRIGSWFLLTVGIFEYEWKHIPTDVCLWIYKSQAISKQYDISCRLLVDVNRYECGLEHQSNANDVSVQSSFNSYSHEEAHQKGKMCKNSIPATWRKQGLL